MPGSDIELTHSDGRREASLPPAGPMEVVGFLLVPGFALMSYASAMEPLRAANRLAGRELYAWRHVSLDGAAVHASNGLVILPDHRVGDEVHLDARSEEHTSELQSLMRISYAVFCLKKKKNTTTNKTTRQLTS